MKKMITIIAATATIIFCFSSCKKNKTATPQTDYSKFRIKTRLTIYGTNRDSYDYTYTNGELSSYTTTTNSGNYLTTINKKSGNVITAPVTLNGSLNITWNNWLNTQGYVDTSSGIRANGSINSTGKSYYNALGQSVREISYYTTYANDIKRFWTDGNNTSAIYDFYDYTTPANSSRDSLVYEYYADKLNYVPVPLIATNGIPNKNLVKKRTSYNTKNANAINRIDDYQYEFDADGLVTKQVWTITNQPSGTVSRRDTTTYTYIKL